jgi:6-phosphofructokinase 1
MRIGILTGGGDAPGLNAAIRAIVRKGTAVQGAEMLGFRNGWRGVMDGDVRELTKESVQGILHRGGTILGSSGADPYHEGGTAKVRRTFADLALDGLIAVGGEGTLGAAAHMTEEGQRSLRHGCVYRLRDGRTDRHGRDRPTPQHGREPPPCHGG